MKRELAVKIQYFARDMLLIYQRHNEYYYVTVDPSHKCYVEMEDGALGLIPCKVIGISNNDREITVRITAVRGSGILYYPGKVFTVGVNRAIPRKSVFTRNGQYRIRNDYIWES